MFSPKSFNHCRNLRDVLVSMVDVEYVRPAVGVGVYVGSLCPNTEVAVLPGHKSIEGDAGDVGEVDPGFQNLPANKSRSSISPDPTEPSIEKL